MFYNGFNLLVDLIIAGIVAEVFYRLGHKEGYQLGQDDYREETERHADYYVAQASEFYDQEVDN